MRATGERITDETVWMALNKLVLTRSNPDIERCYAILLFQLSCGEPFDIPKIVGPDCDLSDCDMQEFLKLVRQL